MTDVRTGKTFAMNDFAGKVVLLANHGKVADKLCEPASRGEKTGSLEGLERPGPDQLWIPACTKMQPRSKNMQIHLASIGTLRFPRWKLIGRSAIYTTANI